MTKGPQVVVVGAGPVGLSVALGLARLGRRVLVLEKDPSTAEKSRAPAIWPGTQEVLARLDVLDRFLDRGIAHSRVTLHDADRGESVLELRLDSLGSLTAHPRLLIVPQSVTEKLLLEALREERTAEIVFSAEVTEVQEARGVAEVAEVAEKDGSSSGVQVTYLREGVSHTVSCDFAVGCDGAHSVVREAIGAAFDGETYETRAALADVEMAEVAETASPRITTRGGLVVGIRIDRGLWRLIIPLQAGDERSLDDRIEGALPVLFPGIAGDPRPRSSMDTVVWKSEFRLHRRVASSFGRGRIVLAGDAAHLNSPVGGQGMNAGIQDAGRLIVALDSALEEGAPRALGGYAEERRKAISEGVNAFTDTLTRLLLFQEGRFVRVFFGLARAALAVPPIRRRILKRVAMVDG